MSPVHQTSLAFNAGSSLRLSNSAVILIGVCLLVVSLSSNASSQRVNCEGKQFDAAAVPSQMSVTQKKLRFRCLVQPAIKSVYQELDEQYRQVQQIINKTEHQQMISQLKARYNATTHEELLIALKPHPASIAIAQAAIETAWGTSRFFREANNLFGIRATNPAQPRIAAGHKVGEKILWIKKYDSIKQSIADYYLVLGRASAYEGFRVLKMKTSDPHQLVRELRDYSERKDAYVKELSSMIRFNQFEALDR